MDITGIDRNFKHLYPPFAELVQKILDQASHETTGKHGVHMFVMNEGFRSQERQLYLYGQGREGVKYARPGPIITRTLHSKHNSGLAADCVPVDIDGNIMWNAHPSIWAQYGHVIRCYKETEWGGDFPKLFPGSRFVDLPHCETKRGYTIKWFIDAKEYLEGLGLK